MHSAMDDLKTTLNSAGICLTILGVALLYFNSPLNTYGIDGGVARTDHRANQRQTARRNTRMRCGTALVVLGSIVQLASNYVAPACASC